MAALNKSVELGPANVDMGEEAELFRKFRM